MNTCVCLLWRRLPFTCQLLFLIPCLIPWEIISKLSPLALLCLDCSCCVSLFAAQAYLCTTYREVLVRNPYKTTSYGAHGIHPVNQVFSNWYLPGIFGFDFYYSSSKKLLSGFSDLMDTESHAMSDNHITQLYIDTRPDHLFTACWCWTTSPPLCDSRYHGAHLTRLFCMHWTQGPYQSSGIQWDANSCCYVLLCPCCAQGEATAMLQVVLQSMTRLAWTFSATCSFCSEQRSWQAYVTIHLANHGLCVCTASFRM